MDAATRDRLKDGFDRAAADYAKARPAYPDEAVDWMLDGRGGEILDLGAGSGALTRPLSSRASRVVAAEPSHNLLGQLRSSSPDALAVQAGAENLPFADRTFDTVTVATAFHWFDHDRALPELARVLRPSGHLALVWNTRAVSAPWTSELNHLLRSAQPPTLQGNWGPGSVHVLDGSPLFAPPEYAVFPHAQHLDRADLVSLVASRSYVIALDDHARARLLGDVGRLFEANADAEGLVELPYRCQCWRARLAISG